MREHLYKQQNSSGGNRPPLHPGSGGCSLMNSTPLHPGRGGCSIYEQDFAGPSSGGCSNMNRTPLHPGSRGCSLLCNQAAAAASHSCAGLRCTQPAAAAHARTLLRPCSGYTLMNRTPLLPGSGGVCFQLMMVEIKPSLLPPLQPNRLIST